MKKDTTNLSVGGYLFYTEKDAQIARAEVQKIEYLEERIDYSAPDTIRYIYEKAIHERIFKTPVGLGYLKQLRDFCCPSREWNRQGSWISRFISHMTESSGNARNLHAQGLLRQKRKIQKKCDLRFRHS